MRDDTERIRSSDESAGSPRLLWDCTDRGLATVGGLGFAGVRVVLVVLWNESDFVKGDPE
jgi:hypothetical protein